MCIASSVLAFLSRDVNVALFHLHAIKVDWGKNARVRAAYLVPDEETLPVWAVEHEPLHDKYYTLQGVQIATPTRGIYIRNGKKVWVK